MPGQRFSVSSRGEPPQSPIQDSDVEGSSGSLDGQITASAILDDHALPAFDLDPDNFFLTSTTISVRGNPVISQSDLRNETPRTSTVDGFIVHLDGLLQRTATVNFRAIWRTNVGSAERITANATESDDSGFHTSSSEPASSISEEDHAENEDLDPFPHPLVQHCESCGKYVSFLEFDPYPPGAALTAVQEVLGIPPPTREMEDIQIRHCFLCRHAALLAFFHRWTRGIRLVVERPVVRRPVVGNAQLRSLALTMIIRLNRVRSRQRLERRRKANYFRTLQLVVDEPDGLDGSYDLAANSEGQIPEVSIPIRRLRSEGQVIGGGAGHSYQGAGPSVAVTGQISETVQLAEEECDVPPEEAMDDYPKASDPMEGSRMDGSPCSD